MSSAGTKTSADDKPSALKKILLIKSSDDLSEKPKSKTSQSKRLETENFYVFMSFDIVDSTKIKHQLIRKWEDVFIEFFGSFISGVTRLTEDFSQCSDLHPWKIQGDEIIFTYKLKTITDIPSLIILTEKLVEYTSDKVKDITLSLVQNIHNHSTPYTIPSVKATMWLADVCEKPLKDKLENTDINLSQCYEKCFENKSDEEKKKCLDKCIKKQFIKNDSKCPNYLIPVPLTDKSKSYEFIGPDIDLGFRIAKYSSKSGITIDLSLAWVLIKESSSFHNSQLPDLSKNLLIHSFIPLKGIWDSKKYPIIRYIPKKDTSITTPTNHQDTSEYTETEPAIKDISLLGGLTEEFKIKDSLSLLIDKLKAIKSGERDLIKRQDSRNPETHCVVICFSTDLKEVLLRKRSSEREDLPDKYDCGCMQLSHSNEPLQEQIKSAYHKRFEVIPTILENHDQPIPIAMYQIKHDDIPWTNGIIFAGIVSEEEAKGLNFYNLSEMPDDAEFAPGLPTNIEKAKAELQKQEATLQGTELSGTE